QPPKNKGKSKTSAKTRTPTLLDGLTQEELSKEQLEEHIVHLREELEREREERNYFQLERDRMHSFREITERQLEEAKAELKNLDKEVEAEEGHHQVELKVYKQKMKHLLCEHQNMILELKADRLASAEVMQKEQEQLETKFHKQINTILKHAEEMTKTRKSWEKHVNVSVDVNAKYEKKMELLPQELDNMSKYQISESENHWNSHVVALIEDHNKALSEMNALVNHMQHDVDINCSLQTQITDMKMKQKEKEKDLVSVLLDNKRLTDFLLNVEEEIAGYEKKMKCYSKGLHVGEAIEKAKNKELNDLKSDYDTLEQLFTELQLERDELYKSFSQRIQKVQHKGDVKNELLERKVKALTDSLEEMQAQLCSVLSASNMDQTALDGITNRIEVLNDSIKNLQYKKARKELLLKYESKQRALGVPVEEICAKPIENILTSGTHGHHQMLSAPLRCFSRPSV
uniref:Dynein regulatory complex subunit 4 n=1 Tax=Mola mola TaxID=94237 RepID=A0A3Q4BLT0_MOLML